MTLYLENKLFTNRKLKNQPDSYKSNEKISIRKNITEFVLTSDDRAKLLGKTTRTIKMDDRPYCPNNLENIIVFRLKKSNLVHLKAFRCRI